MYGKLNPTKLGLSAGIIWGVWLFIMTWIAMFTSYGMFWLSQWMDIYPAYNLSVGGAFLGLIFGFIDAFVSFFIFGWLYNLLKP